MAAPTYTIISVFYNVKCIINGWMKRQIGMDGWMKRWIGMDEWMKKRDKN